MKKMVEEWLAEKEMEGKSKVTIDGYRRGIEKYFAKHDSLDKLEVKEYTMELLESNVKTATVNHDLRCVKAFVKWLAENDYIEDFKIKLVSQQEEEKVPYTADELARLCQTPRKNDSFDDWRDWCVINTVLCTGLRVSSLISIKVSDIDFKNGLLYVPHTKNKEKLVLPIADTLSPILRRYIAKFDLECYLFPNCYNQPIDRNSLSHSIARYNQKHGVSKTSIHLFRHTFASNWVINGGDASRLQRILGHKTPAMTQHYIHVYGKDLASGIDNLISIPQAKHKLK